MLNSNNERALYLGLLTAFLIAAIALAIQFKSARIVGIQADFALTVCIVLGFFLSFREFLMLLLGSAWTLNWQPAVGWELPLFLSIPIIFFFVKRLSPWQPWLTSLAAVFCGVLIFYFGIDHQTFLLHGSVATVMFFYDILFGALVFELFRHFYAPTIHIYF